MRIEVLLFDGFDELDALGPFEVLANAATVREDLEVRLAAVSGPGPVTGSHGVRIAAEATLGEDPDLVIVPGGGWETPEAPGVGQEIAGGSLAARLAALHAGGAAIASVCTGGMLVAAAGLLDGRPAATHAVSREALAAAGAEVTEQRVVDDGDLLSCGGVTAGLDLALWIVEREFGEPLAAGVAAGMDYERRGEVLRGPNARVAR